MKAYKIYRDNTIEAKTAAEAEEDLKAMNGPGKITYYLYENEALYDFERFAADLSAPKDLDHGLKWYDGVILLACDVDDDAWQDAMSHASPLGLLDATTGDKLFGQAVVEDIEDLRVRALTTRERMEMTGDTLGWCEARADDTGRVIAIHLEGGLNGLYIDGVDAGYPIPESKIREAAQIILGDDYGLGDQTDASWVMEETRHTMPCSDCPFFADCDAIDDNDED